ncbi:MULTISPECIES: STAS-like domain-containing protein [unclassified Pseudomonas]|uniref:STAS-like domain-containing protein n=1 Tax=unclassified Pseudomonas TaxID=196821 RepID=UPI00264998A0|nr:MULTISPECIES: STAS-like domain-containing protein [unclassified Pseudomonas]MDN6857291.1 STAS-like domain-containing protein [Pseudomonas sp. CAN1]MDU4254910.1 STAS-like domain-containing protein [Pseudomonas sp.]
MHAQISLATGSETIRTLGMRATATPFRMEIERHLKLGEAISIDFSNKDATQSFVDELVGALILKHGRTVLAQLTFKNCSDDLKSIIRFVINDRVTQVETNRAIA